MEETARKIYLVRHAKPDVKQGIYYGGGTDVGLSSEGAECARTLAQKLGINPPNLCTSRMLRAKQTLEHLFPARRDSFKVVEDLHEILGGDFEMKPFDEIVKLWDEKFKQDNKEIADCGFPNGETLRDVQRRAVKALENLLCQTEGDILIVLHGGVIWTLLCHYFDFDINKVFSYPMHYCSVAELEQNKSGMRLVRFNWTPEL